MTLGNLIRARRHQAGLSLGDIERRTGLSRSLLSQIELGIIKAPGFASVVAICDVLGIDLEEAARTTRDLPKVAA